MNSLILIIILLGLLSLGYGFALKESNDSIAFGVIGGAVALIGVIMAVLKWLI